MAVGKEKQEQERDENKADAAAGTTMAHRPAKTRADAQKRERRVYSNQAESRLTFYVSRSAIILSAGSIFRYDK